MVSVYIRRGVIHSTSVLAGQAHVDARNVVDLSECGVKWNHIHVWVVWQFAVAHELPGSGHYLYLLRRVGRGIHSVRREENHTQRCVYLYYALVNGIVVATRRHVCGSSGDGGRDMRHRVADG